MRLIATWFGCGLLPKMPGTWGSLGALPFMMVWHHLLTPVWLFGVISLTFFLGFFASLAYLRTSDSKDPPAIVIDEVVGQWIALAFIPPCLTDKLLLFYGLGFGLFRFFDILKPWPISWADGLHGSNSLSALGIMLDDALAGLIVLGLFLAFS